MYYFCDNNCPVYFVNYMTKGFITPIEFKRRAVTISERSALMDFMAVIQTIPGTVANNPAYGFDPDPVYSMTSEITQISSLLNITFNNIVDQFVTDATISNISVVQDKYDRKIINTYISIKDTTSPTTPQTVNVRYSS